MNEDSAAALYAKLGRHLYSDTLSKGERKEMVTRRQALLREFGQGIMRPGSRTAASRKHFTLRKPRQREVTEGIEQQLLVAAGKATASAGPLSTGYVVVLLLDHAGEVVFRHDLAVGSIWRSRKKSLAPEGRAKVAAALRQLAGKIDRD